MATELTKKKQQEPSSLKKTLKYAGIVVVCALALLGILYINGVFNAPEEEAEVLEPDTGLTGGIAATVNGTEIEEDKVTRIANNFRIRYNYTEEDDWKEYLENNNYTVESFREEIIDGLIDQELTEQCAEQRGVTTDDEEIQGYVDKMRANYSSDEAWQTALEGAGFDDENAYRDALRYSILDKKLEEGFESENELSDEDLLASVNEKAATYSGSKHTAHIQFNEDEEELANEVLEKIKSGEMRFADAVAEYSKDEDTKDNGGDMGWDRVQDANLDADYSEAITELNAGEVTTELAKTKYGYHIIYCSEVFSPATDEAGNYSIASLGDVPEGILAEIRTTTVEEKTDEAKEGWLDEMRETNDVVVNDMPEGLPYWVQLDESEEEEQAIDEAADEQLADDVAGEEAAVGDLELDGAEQDAAATDAAADGAADSGEATTGQ